VKKLAGRCDGESVLRGRRGGIGAWVFFFFFPSRNFEILAIFQQFPSLDTLGTGRVALSQGKKALLVLLSRRASLTPYCYFTSEDKEDS